MATMKAHFTSFPNVSCISHPFKGVLLDAYGVFWGGNDIGLLPRAKDAMRKMVLEGKIVGILSNSTQRSEKEMTKSKKHGLTLGEHFHFFLTSGDITRSIFLDQRLPFPTARHTFWLLGGIHPRFSSHEALFADTIFQEVPNIQEAEFIYLSIPHIRGEDQVDINVFRKDIEELVRYNLPMVCPNPDRFAHEGNPPRQVVRQGSIAWMYEEMGGKVFYMGKPYPPAYDTALEQFCRYEPMQPRDILMVGDTPETDIRGAKQFGMASALVMQTGIMADRIRYLGAEKAIQELADIDYPDYFIHRL